MTTDIKLYFNEKEHKYKDSLNNPYTSVTQVISQYEDKFDTDQMARNCYRAGLRGDKRYAGKSIGEIKRGWKDITKEALDNGNNKHNYLESIIKGCNGYSKIPNTYFIDDRIYTGADIRDNPSLGIVDIDYYVTSGLKERYPTIFDIIYKLVLNGYKIYSEIGVYDSSFVVSGLIDILAINFETGEFIIIDWKIGRASCRERL